VISFTPQPLYSWGRSPWYILDRRLGGPQSPSIRAISSMAKNINIFTVPRNERQLDHFIAVSSRKPIPSDLSRWGLRREASPVSSSPCAMKLEDDSRVSAARPPPYRVKVARGITVCYLLAPTQCWKMSVQSHGTIMALLNELALRGSSTSPAGNDIGVSCSCLPSLICSKLPSKLPQVLLSRSDSLSPCLSHV
jgi:hypothetical protein